MPKASPALFQISRAVIAAALLAVASGLGGCASDGRSNSYAMVGGGGGATVAFESIDGPPPQVFDRMVGVLDSESKLRNLSVVSREGQAGLPGPKLSRRRRSAMAAPPLPGSGTSMTPTSSARCACPATEPTSKSGRGDAWAAADDLVLRQDRAGRVQRPHRAWSMEQVRPTIRRPRRPRPRAGQTRSGGRQRRAGRYRRGFR